MDINQFYDIVKFISNKHQQGYLSPDEFNNAVNIAQDQLMEELVNVIQGWDGNKRRVKIVMGNAQQAIQKVAPFIDSDTPTIPNTGIYIHAANIAHLLAIRTGDNKKRIQRVEHDRIYSHLSSQIDQIEQNPIYVQYNSYYQIYPENIGQISLEWITDPPAAKWAYTLVSGRPVYDQSNSVQLLWGESEITELISRVLFMFGISVQAQNLISYYQSIKNDGQ
jgi:hydroxymethylpyrimidine pyrophosphatase-like HAD family hydrolase